MKETFHEFWHHSGSKVIEMGGNAEELARLAWHAGACSTHEAELGNMLLSIFSHVSHGGPTREEGETLLRKAGLL